MSDLRCGRRNEHPAHDFVLPAHFQPPLVKGATYHCIGQPLGTLAEREWSDRADFSWARDTVDVGDL